MFLAERGLTRRALAVTALLILVMILAVWTVTTRPGDDGVSVPGDAGADGGAGASSTDGQGGGGPVRGRPVAIEIDAAGVGARTARGAVRVERGDQAELRVAWNVEGARPGEARQLEDEIARMGLGAGVEATDDDHRLIAGAETGDLDRAALHRGADAERGRRRGDRGRWCDEDSEQDRDGEGDEGAAAARQRHPSADRRGATASP